MNVDDIKAVLKNINELFPADEFVHHPKIVGNYTLNREDIKKHITDWALFHLESSSCPSQLSVAVAEEVSQQIYHEIDLQLQDPNSQPNKLLNSYGLYSELTRRLPAVCTAFAESMDDETCSSFCSPLPFTASVFAIKNKRRKMEDRHVLLPCLNSVVGLKNVPDHSYYAVFDGHSGVDAASYVAAHLHQNIANHPEFVTDTPTAIMEAYKLTDRNFIEWSYRENVRSGCTAVCALMREKTLYLSWLGDSQAVLVKGGKPCIVTSPHKPDREDERKRIEDLGGHIVNMGILRVNGVLAVTRAFGDFDHKPYISCEPEILTVDLDGSEDFLILACDGLWDGMSPEEVASSLYYKLSESAEGEPLEAVAGKLVHQSKLQGSEDNITAVVLFLRDIQKVKQDAFLYLPQAAVHSEMNGGETMLSKPTVLDLNGTSEKKLKNAANVMSATGIGNYMLDDFCQGFEEDKGIPIPRPKCLAPEATAFSELPTPPIDDVLASENFEKLILDSSEKPDAFSLESSLSIEAEADQDLKSNNDAFAKDVSSHFEMLATPEEAVDVASEVVNSAIETAMHHVSTSEADSPKVSSPLNPFAEPFVMKSFIPECDQTQDESSLIQPPELTEREVLRDFFESEQMAVDRVTEIEIMQPPVLPEEEVAQLDVHDFVESDQPTVLRVAEIETMKSPNLPEREIAHHNIHDFVESEQTDVGRVTEMETIQPLVSEGEVAQFNLHDFVESDQPNFKQVTEMEINQPLVLQEGEIADPDLQDFVESEQSGLQVIETENIDDSSDEFSLEQLPNPTHEEIQNTSEYVSFEQSSIISHQETSTHVESFQQNLSEQRYEGEGAVFHGFESLEQSSEVSHEVFAQIPDDITDHNTLEQSFGNSCEVITPILQTALDSENFEKYSTSHESFAQKPQNIIEGKLLQSDSHAGEISLPVQQITSEQTEDSITYQCPVIEKLSTDIILNESSKLSSDLVAEVSQSALSFGHEGTLLQEAEVGAGDSHSEKTNEKFIEQETALAEKSLVDMNAGELFEETSLAFAAPALPQVCIPEANQNQYISINESCTESSTSVIESISYVASITSSVTEVTQESVRIITSSDKEIDMESISNAADMPLKDSSIETDPKEVLPIEILSDSCKTEIEPKVASMLLETTSSLLSSQDPMTSVALAPVQTDESQAEISAVNLEAIPDGVPEAEGVTEDIDSDSEKDGGWSYMKGNILSSDKKKAGTSTLKNGELSTANVVSQIKKDTAKTISEVQVKKTGVVDKIKPSTEKKVSNLKDKPRTSRNPTLTKVPADKVGKPSSRAPKEAMPAPASKATAMSTSKVTRTSTKVTSTVSTTKVASTKVAPAATTRVAPAATTRVAPAATTRVAPAASTKVAPAASTKVAPAATSKLASTLTSKPANRVTASRNQAPALKSSTLKPKSALNNLDAKPASRFLTSTPLTKKPAASSTRSINLPVRDGLAPITKAPVRPIASLKPVPTIESKSRTTLVAAKKTTLPSSTTLKKADAKSLDTKKSDVKKVDVKKPDIKEAKNIVNKQISARRNFVGAASGKNLPSATANTNSKPLSKVRSPLVKAELGKKDNSKNAGKSGKMLKTTNSNVIEKDMLKNAEEQNQKEISEGETSDGVSEKEKFNLEVNDKEMGAKEIEALNDSEQKISSAENGGTSQSITPLEEEAPINAAPLLETSL